MNLGGKQQSAIVSLVTLFVFSTFVSTAASANPNSFGAEKGVEYAQANRNDAKQERRNRPPNDAQRQKRPPNANKSGDARAAKNPKARKNRKSPTALVAAERARNKRGAELFEKTGLASGRIVMLFPKKVEGLGKPISGLAGVNQVEAKDLRSAKFTPGTSIVVFERSESGKVSSREVLIYRDGKKLKVFDEALETGGKRRGGSAKANKANRGKPGTRGERPEPGMRKQKGEYKKPQQRANLMANEGTQSTGGSSTTDEDLSSDGVVEYAEQIVSIGPSSTIIVATEFQDEVAVGAWEPIEIQGETPIECTVQGGDGFYTSVGGITSGKCEEVVEYRKAGPGEVWVGTAPFCNANGESCNEIGMKWIASDPYGEGKKCAIGEKALCAPLEAGESVSIWLGTAPFCAAKPEDCTKQGLQYTGESACPMEAGECCKTGVKVSCRTLTEEDPKTQVWIGEAPFCKASKSDCSDRNMNFVKDSKSGDGKKCVSGVKVLCESK